MELRLGIAVQPLVSIIIRFLYFRASVHMHVQPLPPDLKCPRTLLVSQ